MTREEVINIAKGLLTYFKVESDTMVDFCNTVIASAQEPCEDAISRQAVLDCLTATKLKKFDFILHAREEIKKLPSVNPQPKTGHWTHNKCDVCGASRPPLFDNFCPNCGCRMVDPQESEG